MNPITSHYQAQVRMEELHREAEQYRLASQFRPAVSTAARIRSAAGNWLIGAGERLLAHPTTQTAVSTANGGGT
jgi:hypothetical protein